MLTHTPLLTSILIAYPGPDTVLPIASFLAAVVGIFLIFWRFIFGIIRNAFRKLFRRNPPNAEMSDESEKDSRT